MVIRGFIYLTGFGLAVSGGVNAIAYLNLLSTGYSPAEYFFYIKNRPECYIMLIGVALIIICLLSPHRKNENDY
ncbi:MULTISPECIES: hypothetical protein [unclassified Bacillus (in: firmicutes)]|uniref:hypothetical protein n=1 Tax=unclassified Bacillus (in: firmicutes) TaxID=185979 RepID=UPI0008E70885|nr:MULTISPECIES: hypothetical protein [unclassified Bacillus (in: firmicutes)]SFA78659.1 hypothetical protein SAMN02799634_101778 [Bacillus sp. UNCCL13]SFQ68583.1 hypothetical protein SAMN04488577_1052 [Bacillus sp. cl95]